MSDIVTVDKSKKIRKKNLDNLIGPTVSSEDSSARDRLVGARVRLLLKHSFFGNLATRLKLINADLWCPTAATDGRNFYYNSRFINKLQIGEVEFLFGHEVLHVVYDHIGRTETRDQKIFNIANDYAVNADLKRHKVGEFIKTVPCLYEAKYDGLSSEEIYDDLMKNVQKINIDDLIDKMIDEHLDGSSDEESEGSQHRPEPMSAEEREQLRQEIRQNIIAAAADAEAGSIPAGVQRLVSELTDPKLPWRELISTNLTSAIRDDYSFMRPSRKSWHMDAIMPGMIPGELIELAVAIDMSGSISETQAKLFLSEIKGIMETFSNYRIHVFCFDTDIYNPQTFNSENLDMIEEYVPMGGGGTDFNIIFTYLKENTDDTKRLIVFTDGLPYGSWGDAEYTDTTFVIHGSKSIVPPFGTWAYFDE